MAPTLLLAASSIVLAFLSWGFLAASNLGSGLQKIPNAHFTAPYSRLWLVVLRWRQHENRTRLALHRKLGPVVRLGPRELSVDCIEGGVRTIYGSDFAKDVWYQHAFNGEEMPYMFTMLGKEEHTGRKKMLSGMYSNSLIMSSPTLDSDISTMLGHLRQNLTRWAGGAAVDVLEQAKSCLMDVTTAWLYGSANATNFLQDSAARDDFFTNFGQSCEGSFWLTEFPWWTKALRAIGLHLVPESVSPARRHVEEWNDSLTTKALDVSRDSSSTNVSTHFLGHLQKAVPSISDREVHKVISSELVDHVIASHDVAGIGLGYMMYELSRHPERQEALRAEVRTLAEPSNEPLAQRIEDLPMLDAVIMETLRLRSPNPGPWPRVVPESGCRVSEFEVPAGTIVSSTSWTLHRNPVVFQSAEDWLPERWLEADEDTNKEMKKWFWAFGSGARMCTGNRFGIRVMKAILVTIYTDYETIVAENGNVEQFDGAVAGPISNHLYLKFREHA